jgi:hypothetical protein
MSKKLLAFDYHRNGICGTGFYVALFQDDDGGRKVCTWFGSTDAESGRDDCACAVLDVDMAAAGNVEMDKGNAWRGDHYISDMRSWANAFHRLDYRNRTAKHIRLMARKLAA